MHSLVAAARAPLVSAAIPQGLRLFAEALELLRAKGVPIEATVACNGSINGVRERLETLGVTVVNRWLHDQEISHTEAIQSGCVVAALGADACQRCGQGMPDFLNKMVDTISWNPN